MSNKINKFRFDLFALFACLASPIILIGLCLLVRSSILQFFIASFSLLLVILSWISAFIDMNITQHNLILSKILVVVSIVVGAFVFLSWALSGNLCFGDKLI